MSNLAESTESNLREFNVTEFLDRYIAMWHEPDTNRRRSIIKELFASDAIDVLRSLEARGYDAIETRVTNAHEKWVRDGGFVFRPVGNVGMHHNVLKFSWEMAPTAGGNVASVGFDFFILGHDRRIRILYQFGEPTVSDQLNEFANHYVSLWNEADPQSRRSAIAAIWAKDGRYIDPTVEDRGHAAIEAAVAKAYDEFVAKGFVFKSANNADGHHNVVKFNWKMVPAGGGDVAAEGFDFFVLDEDGRIQSDYQFIEVPQAA